MAFATGLTSSHVLSTLEGSDGTALRSEGISCDCNVADTLELRPVLARGGYGVKRCRLSS